MHNELIPLDSRATGIEVAEKWRKEDNSRNWTLYSPHNNQTLFKALCYPRSAFLQPTLASSADLALQTEVNVARVRDNNPTLMAASDPAPPQASTVLQQPLSAVRVPLNTPSRHSMTAKNSLGEYEFYITVCFYPNSCLPGEIFIDVAKEGSTLGGMFNALGLTISLALQYGIPWSVLSRKYHESHFDPSGLSNRSIEASHQWPNKHYRSLVAAVADTIDHLIVKAHTTHANS